MPRGRCLMGAPAGLDRANPRPKGAGANALAAALAGTAERLGRSRIPTSQDGFPLSRAWRHGSASPARRRSSGSGPCLRPTTLAKRYSSPDTSQPRRKSGIHRLSATQQRMPVASLRNRVPGRPFCVAAGILTGHVIAGSQIGPLPRPNPRQHRASGAASSVRTDRLTAPRFHPAGSPFTGSRRLSGACTRSPWI